MKKTNIAPKAKLQLSRLTVADLKQVNGGAAEANVMSKGCGSMVVVGTVVIVISL